MGETLVSPTKGSISFGCGKECWGFNLTKFSRLYSKKFKTDAAKLMDKLWGDNYYDAGAKKWKKENVSDDGKPLKRAFVTFIIEPVIKIVNACMEGNKEQVEKMCTALEINLTQADKEL